MPKAVSPIERLDTMTVVEASDAWAAFEHALISEHDSAGGTHLQDGRPIFYCDERFPAHFVRKWPDGRRELIAVEDNGLVSSLCPL